MTEFLNFIVKSGPLAGLFIIGGVMVVFTGGLIFIPLYLTRSLWGDLWVKCLASIRCEFRGCIKSFEDYEAYRTGQEMLREKA